MNILLGTAAAESTFTNTVVAISRQPVLSSHINLDGSVTIQKAPITKKTFTVTLVRPTSTEIGLIETEHDKDITLNFIHKTITYTVRFIGSLDKSTGEYSITFTLQEV